MRRHVLAAALFTAAVAAPGVVRAQAPAQGVFAGQTGAAPPPPETLDLTAAFSSVYDSRFPQYRNRFGTPNALDQTLYYNNLQTGLWYTKRRPHTLFSADGAVALQQFPTISNRIRPSTAGAMAFTSTTPKSSLRFEQRLRYSPFHGFRIVPVPVETTAPAEVSAPDVALAVSGQPTYESNSTVAWGYQMTNRSTVSAEYFYDYLGFVNASDLNWRTQDARVEWSRDTTRHAALVLGYAYHRRDFELQLPVVRHDLDLGVRYSNALPFSPRTRFDGSVGTSMISSTQHVAAAQVDSTRVRLIGQATLTHQLTRTWHVGLAYNRGWQYIEGLPDVFFAYSLTGTVGGYLGPRVDVRASTGYSNGGLRFSGHQRAYDTNASTARLRVAISRNLAVQAEYFYYRYVFSDIVTLPAGIRPRDNRQVLRVGLTTWIPFF